MELHGLDVLEPALLPRGHETAVLVLLSAAVPLLPLGLAVSPGAAGVLGTVIIPTLAFILPSPLVIRAAVISPALVGPTSLRLRTIVIEVVTVLPSVIVVVAVPWWLVVRVVVVVVRGVVLVVVLLVVVVVLVVKAVVIVITVIVVVVVLLL